jgi:hypothetical protein
VCVCVCVYVCIHIHIYQVSSRDIDAAWAHLSSRSKIPFLFLETSPDTFFFPAARLSFRARIPRIYISPLEYNKTGLDFFFENVSEHRVLFFGSVSLSGLEFRVYISPLEYYKT